jgi:hypothetical protein
MPPCNIRLSHPFPSCHASGQICTVAAERRQRDIRIWQADGENMLCIVPQNFYSFLTFLSLTRLVLFFCVLLLLRAVCACGPFPQPTNAYLIATIFDGHGTVVMNRISYSYNKT